MKKENDKSLATETIQIILPQTIKDQLSAMISQQDWQLQEGYARIIDAGYRFFKLISGNLETAENDQKVETLRSFLIKDESEIASLRFKLYEQQRVIEKWELSSGAIATELAGLQSLAGRHAAEIRTLRAENELMRKQLKELVPAVSKPPHACARFSFSSFFSRKRKNA